MRWSAFRVSVLAVATSLLATATIGYAQDSIVVPVQRISPEGVGEQIGEISLSQTDAALEIVVALSAFPPGWHAMHVHENPSCEPALVDGRMVAGGASGMHFDPGGVMDMDMSEAGRMAPRDGKARIQERDGVGNSGPDAPTEITPPGRRPRPAGDLPAIHVSEDGTTRYRVLTYRLTINQLPGRSILLHEYGEAPDDPALPRGGGDRIACAVVP